MGAGAATADVCTAALAEVELCRAACADRDNGRLVLKCVVLCGLHGVAMPRWLADEMARRTMLVEEAAVGTWDEAFGQAWPPGTRLDSVRRHKQLRERVYAAVWELLRTDPHRSLTRDDVFAEVADMRGIAVSVSQVEVHYYAAIKIDGHMNLRVWRDAARRGESPSLEMVPKAKDDPERSLA